MLPKRDRGLLGKVVAIRNWLNCAIMRLITTVTRSNFIVTWVIVPAWRVRTLVFIARAIIDTR